MHVLRAEHMPTQQLGRPGGDLPARQALVRVEPPPLLRRSVVVVVAEHAAVEVELDLPPARLGGKAGRGGGLVQADPGRGGSECPEVPAHRQA